MVSLKNLACKELNAGWLYHLDLTEGPFYTFPPGMQCLMTTCNTFNKVCINSLWPSVAIWHHRTWSTLALIIARCLTAPSDKLNQCWLEIICVYSRAISQRMCKICWQKISFKIWNIKDFYAPAMCQLIDSFWYCDLICHHRCFPSLGEILICFLIGTRPLPSIIIW